MQALVKYAGGHDPGPLALPVRQPTGSEPIDDRRGSLAGPAVRRPVPAARGAMRRDRDALGGGPGAVGANSTR